MWRRMVHPSIWMSDHFHEYRLTSVSMPSQFDEGGEFPLQGRIALLEVAILQAATMLCGFRDITAPGFVSRFLKFILSLCLDR